MQSCLADSMCLCQMPSVSGQTERRGGARPAQVKLLDVNEVKKLHEHDGRKKQHSLRSPQHSNPAFTAASE